MLMMLVWRFSLVKGLAADASDARLVVPAWRFSG